MLGDVYIVEGAFETWVFWPRQRSTLWEGDDYQQDWYMNKYLSSSGETGAQQRQLHRGDSEESLASFVKFAEEIRLEDGIYDKSNYP